MNNRHLLLIGTGLLILGSLPIARSNTNRVTPVRLPSRAVAPAGVRAPVAAPVMVFPAPAPAEALAAANHDQLTLMPPPADLPRANSQAMVTAATPMAPAYTVPATPAQPRFHSRQGVATIQSTYAPAPPAVVANARPARQAMVAAGAPNRPARAPMAKAGPAGPATRPAAGKPASRVAAVAAPAPAAGPRQLFSYVRLLNYSPHPTNECFLEKQPAVYGNNKYHIEVNYKEGWKTFNDDEGNLQSLGFEINLFENGRKVRTLALPPVAIDGKRLAKGQVLGIAEVAPYRFNIAVDSFTLQGKAVRDLTFRFDWVQKG